MEKYDPNQIRDFDFVTVVKLLFQQWEYTEKRTVTVRGNGAGIDAIKAAVDFVYSNLDERNDTPYITLFNVESGDTLIVEDEEFQEEYWLGGMLVAAEIVSVEPVALPEEEDTSETYTAWVVFEGDTPCWTTVADSSRQAIDKYMTWASMITQSSELIWADMVNNGRSVAEVSMQKVKK